MADIKNVEKLTDEKFVNLYAVDGENSKGHHSHYLVASRAKSEKELKITTHQNKADGVIIYSLYKDKVVLVRQYRYPIDGYIYELPAGLIEDGEDFHQAAIREMHEETGLTLEVLDVDPMYEEPRFTTVGMTDESCAIVYGYASGTISDKYLEESEEIEIVLADKEEIKRILKEERVAMQAAYQLMHYLHDEQPFAFLK